MDQKDFMKAVELRGRFAQSVWSLCVCLFDVSFAFDFSLHDESSCDPPFEVWNVISATEIQFSLSPVLV